MFPCLSQECPRVSLHVCSPACIPHSACLSPVCSPCSHYFVSPFACHLFVRLYNPLSVCTQVYPFVSSLSLSVTLPSAPVPLSVLCAHVCPSAKVKTPVALGLHLCLSVCSLFLVICLSTCLSLCFLPVCPSAFYLSVPLPVTFYLSVRLTVSARWSPTEYPFICMLSVLRLPVYTFLLVVPPVLLSIILYHPPVLMSVSGICYLGDEPHSPNLSDLAECVILCTSWLQSPGKVYCRAVNIWVALVELKGPILSAQAGHQLSIYCIREAQVWDFSSLWF